MSREKTFITNDAHNKTCLYSKSQQAQTTEISGQTDIAGNKFKINHSNIVMDLPNTNAVCETSVH